MAASRIAFATTSLTLHECKTGYVVICTIRTANILCIVDYHGWFGHFFWPLLCTPFYLLDAAVVIRAEHQY